MDETPECPWLPDSTISQTRLERRDAAEHRQRILEVARVLFAEHGVEEVSMQQIALVAEVGKGTLYRRYAHKGELCMDLLRERQESFINEIAAAFQAQADASALLRMDGVLAKTISLLEEQGELLNCIASSQGREEVCGAAPSVRRSLFQHSPWYRWLYELFSNLLTEAVAQGELTSSLDVPVVADALMATLSPAQYRFLRRERQFSSERILQGIRSIYIQGLRSGNA